MLKKALYILVLLLISPLLSSAKEVLIDEEGWPKDVKLKNFTVTIYQPQTESFKENDLQSRAAFSVLIKGKPVFGAMWFSSRVVVDKDERLVFFDDMAVENVKFPEQDNAKIEKFKAVMNERFANVKMSMALDRFVADMEEFEERKGIDLEFNNTAPTIYFETSPAVLVLIDGEPILEDVDNSSYKYVVNTPYFIVQDPKVAKYYLKGGKWWYVSKGLDDDWQSSESVPADIQKMAEEAFTSVESEVDSATLDLKSPPKVVLSKSPAELIVTEGEPKFSAVENSNLLFMENTGNDVIMNINTQEYFVLISGRWYKSKSMESGTWTFVRPDELPEDFKNIPEDSDISNIRTNVAGTDEAREAILENSIPQTAEVDRKTATVEVTYDGSPKFEKIEGTSMTYAVNTDKTVLKIDSRFYCVDEGIWFESDKATGPWTVSTAVPEEVEDIPPSSPVYNVKYVYIYDSTPSVVYVGYTPAYYGSYVYYGTVIYGTGYYYRPWYGAYYYPRPVTYGFGVHYNPWTGWGFSYGVSYGWISFTFHSGGYWGAGGYRYGYRHGYGRGYAHGYRRGYAHGYAAGRRAGYRASTNRARPTPYASNAYRNRASGIKSTGTNRPVSRPANRPTTRPSTGQRPSTKPSTRPSTRPSTGSQPSNRKNNVYTDKSGNIYKRDNSGNWQQRNQGSWQNTNRSNQPSNLNKSYQNRSRGTQRTQSYNRSRPASRPAARPSGGGGRRR